MNTPCHQPDSLSNCVAELTESVFQYCETLVLCISVHLILFVLSTFPVLRIPRFRPCRKPAIFRNRDTGLIYNNVKSRKTNGKRHELWSEYQHPAYQYEANEKIETII